MKVVYLPRAQSDFQQIAAYYSRVSGVRVAEEIEKRLREVIDLIRHSPDAAPRMRRRSHVRVATVVSYPFRIFIRCEKIREISFTSGKRRVDQSWVCHTKRSS